MGMGIILARMLEPSVFGDLAYIAALLSFFMLPLGFSSAQRLVSDQGQTEGLFEKVLGMVLVITAGKLAVLMLFFIYFILKGNHLYAFVGILAGLPMALSDWVGVIRADLEGRGLFKPNFLVESSKVCLHATISITLVALGWGIWGLVLGGFWAFFSGLIIYLHQTDRSLLSAHMEWKALIDQFQKGFWLWLDSTSANLTFRVDKIVLGWFGGPTQLGYYNRAINYGPISHLALNSLMSNASVKALSSYNSTEKRNAYFLKILGVLLFSAVANGIFWQLFATSLVPFIFGPQWTNSVPVFQILGWLGLPYCLIYASSTVFLAIMQYRILAVLRFACLLFLGVAFSFLVFTKMVDAFVIGFVFLGILLVFGVIILSVAIYFLRCNSFWTEKVK
jgi:O-antigen/teichoic acid export membrane protein